MRILVLGASGMLGNAVFRYFSERTEVETFGTLRSAKMLTFFNPSLHRQLLTAVDVENFDSLSLVFAHIKPDVVINCIGLVKQLALANDPLYALPINAMLPHRLARLSDMVGARLIHVSTDCVFSGTRGGYSENDFADADDLYGRSKYLGEVVDCPHVVTLRTSIIGYELSSNQGLVMWFLAQQGTVKGYTKAIFSGVPTVELARVIAEFVLPNASLQGLYHVASAPINKYELLLLLAGQYKKSIDIIPDEKLVIDRSLNSAKFQAATGYVSPQWSELVATMCKFG
ncbi:MAG: SDR family oxidoreductase [Methylococcales bacterium]